MRHRHIIIATALLTLIGCTSSPGERITRSFTGEGINKLVVRAAEIQSATITIGEPSSSIEISGVPTGSAHGYHPSNPFWWETPADRWGFDLVAQRYGDVLVISTKNEISYIHHH